MWPHSDKNAQGRNQPGDKGNCFKLWFGSRPSANQFGVVKSCGSARSL